MTFPEIMGYYLLGWPIRRKVWPEGVSLKVSIEPNTTITVTNDDICAKDWQVVAPGLPQ
jgi:hypothetical protein